MEGSYKAGEENGVWKFYYESGQMEKEGNYMDGDKDGEWKFYYENGHLEKEERFGFW